MIVRLTRRQHGRVYDIMEAEMDERFVDVTLEWLSEDVETASKHRVDVSMPAIAWRRVWDTLFDHCYNNRGMRSKGVRTTEMGAIKQVRRALNIRETHPGLSGISAIGMIAEVLPVWRPLMPDGPYSAFPVDGRFKVLLPEIRKMGDQFVTTWVESNVYPDRKVLRESEHQRFMIR